MHNSLVVACAAAPASLRRRGDKRARAKLHVSLLKRLHKIDDGRRLRYAESMKRDERII